METVGILQWCLDHLNYWTITILMTIESSAIPFPSEIVVPPAAYHAAATGEMNLIMIILAATIGAMLGAAINYFLALWLGRPLIYRFADSRMGHLLMIDGNKVSRAENYFNEHGAVSTLVGRLIPVIRQLISIPAGLAKMNFAKFAMFTSLGAGIWNIVLSLLGYYLERIVPEDQLIDKVTKYSHEIGYGIFAVVATVLLFIVLKKKIKKA